MNVTEARKILDSFGWNTFRDQDGGWQVYDTRTYNGFYTDRALIKLANSMRNQRWRPHEHSKSAVGCGGKWCTCCTKAIPAVMKVWERRALRRKGKKIETEEPKD